MRRLFVLLALAACHHATPSDEPPVVHHIAVHDDVRWPLERRVFAGVVRDGTSSQILELDGNGTRLALPAEPHLAAGTRVLVSGVGRRIEEAHVIAGATLVLGDVRIEDEAAASTALDGVGLEVAIRQTRVSAEGVLVERMGRQGPQLFLRLHDNWVPVLVTVDGVTEARAYLHARVRIEGYLMPMLAERRFAIDSLPIAIAQPRFR